MEGFFVHKSIFSKFYQLNIFKGQDQTRQTALKSQIFYVNDHCHSIAQFPVISVLLHVGKQAIDIRKLLIKHEAGVRTAWSSP